VEINLPDVVAEVTRVFEEYEAALAANDVEPLVEAFWDSELTVRYGRSERLYGAEAIRAWRRASAGVPPGREVGPTVVVTFGRELACVSTEFRTGGRSQVGRQSQTWVRFPEGWRIVAAHVSVTD
jgi:hypothetical protein